jgi:hypothetical protein
MSKRILTFDIGIKNLSLIDITYQLDDKTFIVNKWDIIDISVTDDGYNINTKDFSMLSERLIEKLHELYFAVDVIDAIVIENQPVLKNPIMKSLQITLYTYFLYRKKINKEKITQIKFVNATNKLKPNFWITKSVLDELSSNIADKNKYTQRKKLSVQVANYFLTNFSDKIDKQEKWFEMFSKSKKKDDLGDTLLMSLHFCSAL